MSCSSTLIGSENADYELANTGHGDDIAADRVQSEGTHRSSPLPGAGYGNYECIHERLEVAGQWDLKGCRGWDRQAGAAPEVLLDWT